MNTWIAAKKILEEEKLNLVIIRDETLFKSNERGIRTLLKLVMEGADYHDAVAADRIVGKASAMLYTLLGVKSVYATVLSQAGLSVLEKAGIAVEYGTLTEKIINRAGTGLCPMEDAVKDIDDAATAVKALKKRVEEMAQKQ